MQTSMDRAPVMNARPVHRGDRFHPMEPLRHDDVYAETAWRRHGATAGAATHAGVVRDTRQACSAGADALGHDQDEPRVDQVLVGHAIAVEIPDLFPAVHVLELRLRDLRQRVAGFHRIGSLPGYWLGERLGRFERYSFISAAYCGVALNLSIAELIS